MRENRRDMKVSLHGYQSKIEECKEESLHDREGVTGEKKDFRET
jgi:hypothetical protein